MIEHLLNDVRMMFFQDVPTTFRRGVAVTVAAALTLSAYPVSELSAQTPVFVAEVQRQIIEDRLEALGTLRANESITVTSQVTEVITKIHFDDGQRVVTGDVLAEMTSDEELAQLKEAEANVVEAEEQLKRVSPLAKRGISSGAVLAERQRDFDAAKARLDAVKSRIADRRIRAPFSGVVGLRTISVGALVEPGTVITTVDDDSRMKLDFTIPATFLPTIRAGLPIVARASAFGNRDFKGEVTGIDSRVDPVTRSIALRAILPNPDGILRAGALMTVDLFKNKRDALVVPEKSILAKGRKNFVFIVDPKADQPTAVKREIKIGRRQTGLVEVLDGVKVGQHVITDGTLKVRDGSVVKVVAREQPGKSLQELLQGKVTPKTQPAG
jgi:membrane fusion protein, multidrug efflux system